MEHDKTRTKPFQNLFYRKVEKAKKVEKTGTDDNVKILSEGWFKQDTNEDCIVDCSKQKARFHRRHCEFFKFLENVGEINIEELVNCDDHKCVIAKMIKESAKVNGL